MRLWTQATCFVVPTNSCFDISGPLEYHCPYAETCFDICSCSGERSSHKLCTPVLSRVTQYTCLPDGPGKLPKITRGELHRLHHPRNWIDLL